jgi:hypothetical protein
VPVDLPPIYLLASSRCSETDQEGSREDDEEDLADEIDESSDWAPEPETLARAIKHGHLDFHSHSHDCHAEEDACSHLLSNFPRYSLLVLRLFSARLLMF